MHNRRRNLRIPFVSISSLTRLEPQSTSSILVQDICKHGMRLLSKEEFRKGESVLVQLIFSTDLQEKINDSIVGEVVWTNPLPDSIHYAVGIRFDDVEVEKPELYTYVKRLQQMNIGV